MTAIFLLADEFLPDVQILETLLQQAVGDRYTIQRVTGRDALQEKLYDARQAVVFFSGIAETMAAFIHQCRFSLPGTACVAVVDADEMKKIPVLETDCHFIQRPLDAFSVLAQLSGAIRQAKLLSTLSGSAQIDEVTNLFNRSYFLQRLSEEMSLSRRHLSPLCCVVIGLNFYKIYLDSYGYDFINAYLRFLGDKITNSIRHEDLVARLSDEEIGICLPRSTEKGAKVFTNRLILNLNASIFRYGGFEEEVSVCAGLVGYPMPDSPQADADTLIRYGRHAVHQARCTDSESIRVQLFSEIKPAI